MFKENGITEELYRIIEAQGPEFTKAFYVLIMCGDERPAALVRGSSGEDQQQQQRRGVAEKLLGHATEKDEYALSAIAVLTQSHDIAEQLCLKMGLIRLLAPVVAPQNPGMAVAAVTAPHIAEPVWRIIANTCWVPGTGRCLCEGGGFKCAYTYLAIGPETLQCAALQAIDGICCHGTQEDAAAVATELFACGDLPGVVANLCAAPHTPAVQCAALRLCATLAAAFPRFRSALAGVPGSIDILLRHTADPGAVMWGADREGGESNGGGLSVAALLMERALCILATLVSSINLGAMVSNRLIHVLANAVACIPPRTHARLHAINALGCYSAYADMRIATDLVNLGAVGVLVAAMAVDLGDAEGSYAAGKAICSLSQVSPDVCGETAISAGVIQHVVSFLTAKDPAPLAEEEAAMLSSSSSSSSSLSLSPDVGGKKIPAKDFRELGVHIAMALSSSCVGMNTLGSSQQALQVLVDIFTDASVSPATKDELTAVFLAMFREPDIAVFDKFLKVAGLEGVFDLLVSR